MESTQKSFSAQELAGFVNGRLEGETDVQITAPEQLSKAQSQHVTFIGSSKFAKLWPESKASVAVVNNTIELEPGQNRALIFVQNADLAMAKLLEAFQPEMPDFEEDIHPTAVIHPTVKMGVGCKIGAHSYVGQNVVLGDGVTIYPNVSIFDDTTIGSGTTIWSGTVIRERTEIGMGCTFHLNVSIGADGFGYRPADDGRGLVKIPQIGNVVIGHGVEIGANSSVDRGKFSSTIIGDGCKIDNLVQIAHNCVMGRSCIMAGASGLAGSVTLGDGVIIGGGTCIKDHITIGSGAVIGAMSGVMNDVAPGKTYLGYPAVESRDMLRQWSAMRKLAKK